MERKPESETRGGFRSSFAPEPVEKAFRQWLRGKRHRGPETGRDPGGPGRARMSYCPSTGDRVPGSLIL